jgi:uncharacterized protein YdeI (YjbR/CyaY-like superfamily)
MEITESIYLKDRKAWRAWLAKHHATKREIWLIYFKKGSGKPRVAYADAVEEALCFGWIDSIVKTMDAHRYAQRFTPRKPGSNWSGPNLERVRRLVAAGLMTPAGAAHIPSRSAAKAFEQQHRHRTTATIVAPRDLAAALRRNAGAAALWKTLAPGYKRLYVRMVNECKLPETRRRRIVMTVDKLARGLKHPLA